jgi:hypothetical protein
VKERLRIIVTGLIAQHPTLGGVAWDYLAYPAALRQMGHDVFYFEDSGEWPYNLDGGPSGDDWVARDPSVNVRHLANVMERFGLGDRWAYRFPIDDRWFGMSDDRRRAAISSADLLINVSGTLEHPDHYRGSARFAYIDSDPVFTQIKWILDGEGGAFRQRVDAHDVHFSFGERFSDRVPRTPHAWLPTRQPLLLDEWRTTLPYRDVFTTVMSWTSYKPIRFGARTYAQKDVEFRQFMPLPQLVPGTSLEVALHATEHVTWETRAEDETQTPAPGEGKVRRLSAREHMAAAGWHVVDPHVLCGELDNYRAYIQQSKGEWSVSKNGYVAGSPGWFSCRSACYLAAGRPVIVQDTGLREIFPTQQGVVLFDTLESAVDAIADVQGRYTAHARAAREIACAYFDHVSVLNALISAAGMSVPESSLPGDSGLLTRESAVGEVSRVG